MALHKNFGKGKGKARKTDNPNDEVNTPEKIARFVISKFDLYGTVLDAFRGNGVFYDNYPEKVNKD